MLARHDKKTYWLKKKESKCSLKNQNARSDGVPSAEYRVPFDT